MFKKYRETYQVSELSNNSRKGFPSDTITVKICKSYTHIGHNVGGHFCLPSHHDSRLDDSPIVEFLLSGEKLVTDFVVQGQYFFQQLTETEKYVIKWRKDNCTIIEQYHSIRGKNDFVIGLVQCE